MRWHLFHTNDFHNGLTDEGAARLMAATEAVGDAPWLLVDAGDAIKAGNLGLSAPGGEPILTTMGDLGYTAMTQGNRETHPSRAAVCAKLSRARFPVLSANLRPKKPDDAWPLAASTVVERGGLRIAVFGLTVPMVTARSGALPRSVWECLYDDPLATAADLVPTLRESADFVLALTHIGITGDRKLAQSVPGIDLIVSGHTHLVFEQPEVVDGVPILQAGSHGRFFGHGVFDGVTLEEYALHPLKEAA